MRSVHFTDDAHKRGLAWVRKMALATGDVEAEELLEHLELDRPPRELVRNVVALPLASRRAPRESEWEKHLRVDALERMGQDAARRMIEEANRG